MQQKTQRPAAAAQRGLDLAQTSWEDLRVFLICADSGSLRKAAEALDVTNTTVMRVVDRLEMQLGCKLFVRHQTGLQPTEEARGILEDVRQMERLSYNVFRRAAQTAESPSGVVRVAVTEGVGTYWVMPKLIEFQGTYRLLTVDLRCAMEQADVARLEADIAIQFEKPTRPDLIVTRLGRLHVYPFVSADYARVYGLPTSVADVQKHRIVQQVAPQLDETAYARALGVESVTGIVGIRTNSSTATLYAVEKGAGIGMLPTCSLALGAPLVPVDIGIRHHLDLWLTYHADFRRSERHIVVVDWLRRVFDDRAYPCFKDEFIHPNELVELMAGALPAMGLRGFAAPAPFAGDRRARAAGA
jgi:DNA-binding transcriptional LysR family regulator